ncbi:MAG: flagellar basal body L-ring protein FlgH [Parvularculaceae bacterium]
MNVYRLALSFCALMGAASCAGELGHMGRAPKFSEPGGDAGRLAAPAAAPDAPFMAYAPPAEHVEKTSGSLWSSGPDSLFGDRRARGVGDIVTIVVEIDDEAEMRNRTERKRSGSDEINVPALLGAGSLAEQVLPGGAGLDPAIDAGSSATSKGEGTIRRNEKITLRVAAIVRGVMPNGHLVVQGSQEVRVNYELRDLQVAGIIRPEDISRANTITYDKIAEARISYGGRGQITDLQKARYGQQIIDLISPF